MKKLKELIISLVSLPFILYAIYYFYLIRHEIPLTFWFIIATCAFLIVVTLDPKIITGMEITIMCRENAQHYHSIVMNMGLGYSAVVGIGITLIWPEQGLDWRNNVAYMLVLLTIYFIAVMYIMFLRKLRKQIADKN
jgi:hypothetical protein